ncbi:Calx-beta domain-containing protein [Microcoleus sp. D2_18a_D3]|uniref:Calx-beta domain-containing protein n=1 Tax=Microcoleus sp. D2_18a_D3 TaxID=3055330 RepID=UPI002FCFE85D
MATSFTGSLGQTNNYSALNDLIAKWPTAAQNQGIKLSGIAFDGFETDYLNPSVISNLTLATNENPKSWLSYGSTGGIGAPSSYDGWFTDAKKNRAEINHNPNTNQSQALKVKWADNQDITSATIDLSALSPKTSPGLGDQGNEVGLLQVFNNGVLVPATNFTFTRLNAPIAPKPLAVSSDGVTFIGDRTDGSFKFKIDANPLGGATFDELRFSTKAYDSATAAYVATPFKDDGSDYLVRNIEYQGTEDPISLQFSAPTFSVNENGTAVAAVTVTRTGSSVGTASATVNLTNGTATAPGDYNNAPISVNFANGDTAAKTITIPIVDDTLVEGNETVNLRLTNPTGTSRVTLGTQSTATLNIVDNDTSLQFSAPEFSVNEDGTPIAAVTVTRTGSTTGAVSATVNLSNGTATTPGDYFNVPLAVNFASGDSAPKTVTIPIVNDTLVEELETLQLRLTQPTGNASLGTQNTATLNIVDNDSTLQFSAPEFSVNEDGTPNVAVTVTRTGSTTGAVSATVNLSNGSATTPGDYFNVPLAVNFASGDSAPKTVTIPIVNDTLVEELETLQLTLTQPKGNASLGTQKTATLDIVDDDSTLQFSAPEFSVNEDGTPIAAVTVTRTGSTTGAVSAMVDLTNVTTAPDDYSNVPIFVNFGAGDSAPKIVTIPIVNDTLVEDLETLQLTLTQPTGNASLGTQKTATLDIVDDDTSLQFSAQEFSVNEDGTPNVAVTVTRIGSATGAVSATVELTDETATTSGDYFNVPLAVNFASGDTADKTITIPIINDTLVEEPETLQLRLILPTANASIGTPSTATLTIVDDDVPATPINLPIGSLIAPVTNLPIATPIATPIDNEDGTPIAAVTVTPIGSATGAVSATVELTNGTATNPDDHFNVPLAVNFASGDTADKTITLGRVNDALEEDLETVNLSLTNPTGNATIETQSTAILNILDDEVAPTPIDNEDDTPIAAVTVTPIGSATGAVSATVELTNGTATNPDDHFNVPLAVNFASGDTADKTITLGRVDDALEEDLETVNLSLTNPTGNATIETQSTAILNILDDEVAPARVDPLSAASIVFDDPLTGDRSASAIGGILPQDSSLLVGAVDISNFITNYFNWVASAHPSVTVAGTQNWWWPSPTGSIVGALDQNPIAGAGTGSSSFNPFATSV